MRIDQRGDFWINSGLCCLSIVICLAVIELSVRVIIHKKYPGLEKEIHTVQDTIRRSDYQKPLFRPHPYLSFSPSDIELTADGCMIAGEKFSLNKPPGVLRIACLGGSTTMRAYPIFMKMALEECFPAKKIEVMDWGCSSWTIVESMINYMVRGRLFRPDVIISHEGINDVAPRLYKNFSFDYSHYRRAFTFECFTWRDIVGYQSWLATWLRLRAGQNITDLTALTIQSAGSVFTEIPMVDPETSTRPYRESLDAVIKMAKSDGAAIILAGMVFNVTDSFPQMYAPIVGQNNSIAQEYAKNEGLPYVDMQQYFERHKEYFVDHVHTTGLGDQIKGYLLASAVSMLKEGTPCVSIPDCSWNRNTVFSKPENRNITIHWNSFHHDVNQVQIFVRVNGGDEKLLIKLQSTNCASFNWMPWTGCGGRRILQGSGIWEYL